MPTSQGPYRTQASAQDLMQVLTREVMKNEQQREATAPLLGAHVLLAASASKRGVCARSFETLGLTSGRVAAAASTAIAARRATPAIA